MFKQNIKGIATRRVKIDLTNRIHVNIIML